VTRWHLGERLAKVERGHGPWRGIKDFSSERSFTDVLDKIGLATRHAQEAQRIACLLAEELEPFCNAHLKRRLDAKLGGEMAGALFPR
jgi:hypothetical protein